MKDKPETEEVREAPEPPRRGRPSSGIRSAIVLAAIDEFAREGFGGARVERISKSAGTSDRMLYYYFESKDGLFQAALEKVHEDFVAAASSIELGELDPREALWRLVAFVWRHYLNHPQFISLVNTENRFEARHATQSDSIPRSAAPQLKLVDDLLRRGVESGHFRRDATAIQVHLTIVSLCYYYQSNAATMSNYLGYDMRSDEALDAWLGHITRVVLDWLIKT